METIVKTEVEDPINHVQLFYTFDNSKSLDEACFIQYLPNSTFPPLSEGIYIYTHPDDCQTQPKNLMIYITILAIGIMLLLLHAMDN
ncbi:hypothetical protein SteCoe_36176 [Stentor coeruleus]|uniref:Uncharacterized protein n=1 Tax=Stentor coeruleus TaxID=5963 RepID=A0A1R2AQT5_9CILI|nr:hypothetical protein SteCoe_36176 [Stentor coeruleus]